MLPDKVTYENLEISFIVDEFLENYRSLHEWMTAIGFPEDNKQFSTFRGETSNTPIETQGGPNRDIGIEGVSTAARSMFARYYHRYAAASPESGCDQDEGTFGQIQQWPV